MQLPAVCSDWVLFPSRRLPIPVRARILHLNPPLTPAFDQATIPYYNVYFSDTWHMKPTFTLTYGLGWALEMPPVEKNGKQVEVVDASDQPVDSVAYIEARRRAALLGQVLQSSGRLCPRSATRALGRSTPTIRSTANSVRALRRRGTLTSALTLSGAKSSVTGYRRTRRLWPAVRPPERCRSGAGTAARHRSYPACAVHSEARR